jgi:hypothetical protein
MHTHPRQLLRLCACALLPGAQACGAGSRADLLSEDHPPHTQTS